MPFSVATSTIDLHPHEKAREKKTIKRTKSHTEDEGIKLKPSNLSSTLNHYMKQNLCFWCTIEANDTCKNVYYTLCTCFCYTPHLHTNILDTGGRGYATLRGSKIGQKRNKKWDGEDIVQHWKMTGQSSLMDGRLNSGSAGYQSLLPIQLLHLDKANKNL